MNDTQLREILKNYPTPFYLLDAEELQNRMAFLRKHLPSQVELCYAVKANPFLVRELLSLADRFEICSPGELAICQKMGVPSEKQVVSGVYKNALLMQQTVQHDVQAGASTGIYTVESMSQFSILQEAAKAAGTQLPVLLRLTSGNQFGLDEDEIEQMIAGRFENPWLHIRGIQYFSGTQKTSLKRLQREINLLDSFLEHLSERYGYQAEELEFGPGLPVSYFEGEAFDEPVFLREFSALLEDMNFSGKIILELGRSIAASCGRYLTQVVDLKTNRQGSFAIVDGGMHQLVYFGQSMAMKQPGIRVLSPYSEAENHRWNICGSLCTVNDILVKQMPLPPLHIGDVLVFEKTGAYCMTEGISLFLSRDLPKVLLATSSGKIRILRDSIETEIFNTPNYFEEI